MTTAAEMFMKYDYAEMKDLLKAFITLTSATIVFSLTFSDKVIGYQNAGVNIKRLIVGSWSLMIVSLLMSGISLVLIASAAGKIIYGSIPFLDIEYWTLTWWSVAFGLLAGATFVAGLIVLITAVARTIPTSAGPSQKK